MKKSKNEQVRQFLTEIKMVNEAQFDILQQLRTIVFDLHPETKERMMYGGIMFSLDDDFGGIFVRKKHISFEFGQGAGMDDPDQLLEGGGQFRRHLKLRSLADVTDKKVAFFVKQAK